MARRRHPLYTAFMVFLVVMMLLGLALLVWGSVAQGQQPRLWMIPPQVHHG